MDIVLPTQTKKTARIGSAPVNSAPVNDPKVSARRGAAVVTTAPHTSGMVIIPPGTRSTVCLILIRIFALCAGPAFFDGTDRHPGERIAALVDSVIEVEYFPELRLMPRL